MFIKNYSRMFESIRYFIKLIFFEQKYDVVFVTSSYFNRGKKGENLLLKPMIECCKKNEVNFIIFEDTDLKGNYDKFIKDQESIPLDIISLFQILLRKFYFLINTKPLSEDRIFEIELSIAKILKSIFFRKFYSKVYVTLLWNNITLWRSVNPCACVIDYQHGIIFDGHKESVKDGNPPKIKVANDIVTFVHGDLFKKILIDNDDSGFYSSDNVITVGFNKERGVKSLLNNKKILFTLQIVPDFDNKSVYELYIKIIEKIIHNNAEFLSSNNYEIIFKHHPRFTPEKCPELKLDYDFIRFDSSSTDELFETVSLHMTFHSTSAIDAAINNIPTIFIDMHENFSPDEIFLNQYKYPFKNLIVKDYAELKNVLENLSETRVFKDTCTEVEQWTKELYQDFNESIFYDFLFDKIENT